MKAALAFAAAALPAGVLSQVITVTQYASTCKAIYTTGSSTVTVVQSTVTASPTSLTDASLNAGVPFFVQIQPDVLSSGSRRRQADGTTYLTAEGYTTMDASQAVQYRIMNGTLIGTSGQWVSTNASVQSMPFALSSTIGSISTEFFSEDLNIRWENAAFDGGAAQFFTVDRGNGSQQVIVRFRGPTDPSWDPVTFAAQSTGGLGLEPLPPAVSTVVSMGSMTIPYTSPTSQPTGNVNPDGICGGTSGFDCYGAPSGSCCSGYGYCGQGPDYCGEGCQSGFGTCNVVSSSAVIASSASPSIGAPGGVASSPAASPQASSRASPPAVVSSSSPAAQLTPTGGSVVWSSSAVTSSATGVPVSGAALSTTARLSTLPVLSSPVLSTSLSVAVVDSSSVTYSVTFTSTPSSSWVNLPTYSGPGQPIGPVGPISSSQVASSSSSSLVLSSSSATWITTSSSIVPPAYSSSAFSIASSVSSALSSVLAQSSSASPTWTSSSSLPAVVPVQTPSSSFAQTTSSTSSSTTAAASSSSTTSSAVVSSTAIASSTSVTPSSSSTFSRSSSAAVTSSTPSAVPTAICPFANGTVVTDPADVQYLIGCSLDADQNLIAVTQTTYSVAECMPACDAAAYCQGFTWVGANGAVNGLGAGNCYLKGPYGPLAFSTLAGLSDTKVSGLRQNPPFYDPSSTVRPTSTSTSAPGYTIPSSSTVLLSSSSSIAISSSSSVATSSSSPEAPAYISPIASTTSSSAVVPTTTSSTTTTTTSSSASSLSPTSTSSSAPLSSSSTAVSSSSSSSAYLVIPSPTLCSFGDPPNYDEDDSYCEVDLPQPMYIYSRSDTKTYPSTNGYISITVGSSQYEAQQFPSSFLPDSTISPLFDDWYVYGSISPAQGIWSSLDAEGVWYEYYLGRAGQTADIQHFTVRYEYATPGVFTYTYYDLSGENGEFASVGMQGIDANGDATGFTYSFQTSDITPGLVVTCDSNNNICTTAA